MAAEGGGGSLAGGSVITSDGSEGGEHSILAGLGSLALLGEDLLEALLLVRLAPAELGRLSCVSGAFRVLCAEEPLWQAVALSPHQQPPKPFKCLGSWRATAVAAARNAGKVGGRAGEEGVEAALPSVDLSRVCRRFTSMHLYRRWYRCNVDTSSFTPPKQGLITAAARRMTAEQFEQQFDQTNQPALLSELAEDWPARRLWSLDALLQRCGDAQFRVSSGQGRRLRMKLRDYVAYMQRQRDEEPLYIFDSKFLEAAPMLADDYSPPAIFRDDFLSCLGHKRPDYQWLVIGPPRSGASWHVDPALTSAWNILLVGRKRWALYPPDRTPPGVAVTFDEDGEMDIEQPSSLRWLLEVRPQLGEAEAPVEFVQGAGETVFVPGGWWHMVLNLEATVAVTHNFVSCANLPRVVDYMASGERVYFGAAPKPPPGLWCNRETDTGEVSAIAANEAEACAKRQRLMNGDEKAGVGGTRSEEDSEVVRRGFLKERKLGVWLRMAVESQESAGRRARVQELALAASRDSCDLDLWRSALSAVCEAIGRPPPRPLDALPVWGGDTAVFFLGNAPVHGSNSRYYNFDGDKLAVVKFFCKDSLESSRNAAACEREAYGALLSSAKSSCKPDNEFAALAEALPSLASPESWGEISVEWEDEEQGAAHSRVLPYLVSTRKLGVPLSMVRPEVKRAEWVAIARFLGRHLAALHCLPLPRGRSDNAASSFWLDMEDSMERGRVGYDESESSVGASVDGRHDGLWRPFCSFFNARRQHMWRTLTESGLLPEPLVAQLDSYLPQDFRTFLTAPIIVGATDSNTHAENLCDAKIGSTFAAGPPCWLHGDLTSFNVLLLRDEATSELRPSAIVDLGDAGHGDPLYDLVALHVGLFRCEASLLRTFLDEYRDTLRRVISSSGGESGDKGSSGSRLPWWLDPRRRQVSLSRAATCYLLLHKQELISGVWKSMLRSREQTVRSSNGERASDTVGSFAEVEHFLWSPLTEISASAKE